MSTESVAMGFSVSGEFITDHFRSLVREGDWRSAVEGLQNSFGEEMTLDLVIDILSGKKKMVGVNDLSIESDDLYQNDEWLHDQYFTYLHNIIIHNNEPYKAYACVEVLMYTDMTKLKDMYDGNLGIYSKKQINELRALTYANNMSEDVAFHMDDQGWIICEEFSNDLPIWIKKQDVKELVERLDYNPLSGIMRFNTEEDREYMVKNSIDFGRNAFDEVEMKKDSPDIVERFFKSQEKVEQAFDRLDEVRDIITKKANEKGGWLELYDEEKEKSYKLPRNAFYRWCMANNGAWKSIDWEPVSPRGMKMGGDDPNHTDWWLFTGYTLDESYNTDLMSFFFDEKDRIHKELTGHEFTTLLRGNISTITGGVKHINSPEDAIYDINRNDVIIIPNASPDFESIAHKCAKNKAVLITEVGGKLCHLATVGREFGLTLLMIPDARNILSEGVKVDIDIQKGKLKIEDLSVEEALTLKISGEMYG